MSLNPCALLHVQNNTTTVNEMNNTADLYAYRCDNAKPPHYGY